MGSRRVNKSVMDYKRATRWSRRAELMRARTFSVADHEKVLNGKWMFSTFPGLAPIVFPPNVSTLTGGSSASLSELHCRWVL